MSIKCPNCNHDIFDDYKCPYCQYVINPKPNNYEKEIYDLENYKSKEEVNAESIVVAKYNNNKVSTKIKLLFLVLTLLSTIINIFR